MNVVLNIFPFDVFIAWKDKNFTGLMKVKFDKCREMVLKMEQVFF
jgi:hypothetical protein